MKQQVLGEASIKTGVPADLKELTEHPTTQESASQQRRQE
jgi:hypothetical protein